MSYIPLLYYTMIHYCFKEITLFVYNRTCVVDHLDGNMAVSVTQPVQESRASPSYMKQGVLSSCKVAKTSSSCSSRVGRSRLEEDGVTSHLLHMVY